MMEKYITDERTGLKYELIGDYYLIVGEDEPEEGQPIGTWGQRHLCHLKRHYKVKLRQTNITSNLILAFTDFFAELFS